MSMSCRPVTSKSRGVCAFYGTTRGCVHGDSCKFLHGVDATFTGHDKSKVCKFFAAGYCTRGEACWFRHEGSRTLAPEVPEPEEDEDDLCGICQDKPATYGLLGKLFCSASANNSLTKLEEQCNHIFCVKCIREWRDLKGKTADIVDSGNTRKCPYCRTTSYFVTPSSTFYTSENPRKAETILKYKASMKRTPCKHFNRSPPDARKCPFRNDCFYQHLNEDGSPYVFDDSSRQTRRRLGVSASNASEPWNYAFERLLQNSSEIADRLGETLTEGPAINWIAQLMLRFRQEADLDRLSEDGHETQAVSSFAAPIGDFRLSPLPLTRAFMDSTLSVDTLTTDVNVMHNDEQNDAQTNATNNVSSTASRSSTLPNHFAYTANTSSDASFIATLSPEERSEESMPTVSLRAGQSSPSLGEAEGTSPDSTVDVPAEQNHVEEDLRQRDERSVARSLTDGSIHATASHELTASASEERERDHQGIRPSRRILRRTKSSSSASPCVGRPGRSFVTDGRGRVVATDDCYTSAGDRMWEMEGSGRPLNVTAAERREDANESEPIPGLEQS